MLEVTSTILEEEYKRPKLLEIYRADCPHCIGYSPVFKKIVKRLKDNKNDIDIIAFNLIDLKEKHENLYKSLRAYFHITEFPTLRYYTSKEDFAAADKSMFV